MHLDDVAKHLLCPSAPGVEAVVANQTGFAAMEGDQDSILAGDTALVQSAREGGFKHLIGHQRRPPLPRGIGHVEHVAIRTIQVAARRNLEDDLAYVVGFSGLPKLIHGTPHASQSVPDGKYCKTALHTPASRRASLPVLMDRFDRDRFDRLD